MNSAAVSAALNTTVVEASVNVREEPALCAFEQPSQSGLAVWVSAFPATTGRYKNLGLASIRRDLKAAVSESASLGATYRITEHPEWGTDAFSVLVYNSKQLVGVQVWTSKYSSAIDPGPSQLSESASISDATNLGDALVHASK